MRTRITERDVRGVLAEVQALATAAGYGQLTLHQGSHEHGITNKLLHDRTNLWPDGMGGTTRRDAWNALRVMRATLAMEPPVRVARQDLKSILDTLTDDEKSVVQIANESGWGSPGAVDHHLTRWACLGYAHLVNERPKSYIKTAATVRLANRTCCPITLTGVHYSDCENEGNS